MRSVVLVLLVGGCVPHLYSDRSGSETGSSIDTSAQCDWSAPTNTWSAGTPPDCLQAQGWDPGQVVPDLRLNDQFGAEVSLWQFSGDLILLDVSTLWCVPCQNLGADAEDTWQSYKDQGFVYVTVIQQDSSGNPAQPADVQAWADSFGITAPVLGDPDAVTTPMLQLVGGAASFPGVLLIGRDLKVIERVGSTVQDVQDAVTANL